MNGLETVLSAARSLHAATPAMQAFSPWECRSTPKHQAPQPMPALGGHIKGGFDRPGTAATQLLIDAIRAAADLGHWIQTYTEAEVGRHFLDNYGYYELIGPGGHFQSEQMRGYVAYWGGRVCFMTGTAMPPKSFISALAGRRGSWRWAARM